MGQEFYKKIYSVREFYTILYQGLRTVKYMRKAEKDGEMTQEFIERIMLAVTEVNGCEVCSYGHAKMALERGVTDEEIQMLLSGKTGDVPVEEAQAVFFAQHYADQRGKPDRVAWEKIVSLYGKEKAYGILGAIRMIMVGNAYGIAFSAFRSRLRGKPIVKHTLFEERKLSIFYELGMLLSLIPFLPITIVRVILANVTKRPVIQFA
jgi:AhpD family alkylhydroperoxidase